MRKMLNIVATLFVPQVMFPEGLVRETSLSRYFNASKLGNVQRSLKILNVFVTVFSFSFCESIFLSAS